VTFQEAQSRRAELMPKLERLLLSLKHWRATNKMKMRYSHEDPRAGTAPTVIPFPTTTH
jgi:hypothetical protein